MQRDTNHVRQSRVAGLLLAVVALLVAACGGGEETTSGVASIADVETEPTAVPTTMPETVAPTPETVVDPAEDSTEAQDTGSAETSADPPPTDTAGSDSDATETSTSEGVIAEDATDEDMALAFVVCVREAGFDEMPDPTITADGSVQLLPPGQQQLLGDPDFQEAAEGCVNLIEEATFFTEAPDISDFEDSLLEFARCLRDNGLDVDDPDLSRFVPGQGARMFGDNFDPQDPANADAIAACQDLLPNAGGN
jgi:hypothetical protein